MKRVLYIMYQLECFVYIHTSCFGPCFLVMSECLTESVCYLVTSSNACIRCREQSLVWSLQTPVDYAKALILGPDAFVMI